MPYRLVVKNSVPKLAYLLETFYDVLLVSLTFRGIREDDF